MKKEIADLCKKIEELAEEERKEIGIYSCDPNELTEEKLAQVSGGGVETNIGKVPLVGIDPLNRPSR